MIHAFLHHWRQAMSATKRALGQSRCAALETENSQDNNYICIYVHICIHIFIYVYMRVYLYVHM